MKRILAIVLTLVMMLTVLTGCTTPKTSAGLNGKQSSPSTEQAAQQVDLLSIEQAVQPWTPPIAEKETQPSTLPSIEQETQPSTLPSIEQETQPSNPPVSSEIKSFLIDSVDKLNYYAALRMVAGMPVVTKQTVIDSNGETGSLTESVGDDKVVAPTVPDATELISTEGPPLAPDNPNPTNPSTTNSGKDIIYYKLTHRQFFNMDPNQTFYIKKVNVFQIELTDENGFLASKLGLGVVDVVITENCIGSDSLITFRNGDKYFSCLKNGWSRIYDGQRWEFSTHKYVEDLNIVKNFQQENYAFYVTADAEGQIVAFKCKSAHNGGQYPDQNVKIVSNTRIATGKERFTIAQLEDYVNSSNAF